MASEMAASLHPPKRHRRREHDANAVLLVNLLSHPSYCCDTDSSLTFHFLTLRDLIRCRATCHTTWNELATIALPALKHASEGESKLCPWPAFPGLFRTPSAVAQRFGLYAHQRRSLLKLCEAERGDSKAFGALRGGVFGDAPGLGKTVTCLALVLSTAGQYPRTPLRELPMDLAAWRELQNDEVGLRRSLLAGPLKGISEYQQSLGSRNPDFRPVQTLIRELAGGQWPSIEAFERECALRIVNELKSAEQGDRARMLDQLRHGAGALRLRCTDLTDLAPERRRRLELESSLQASRATLIVVPDHLLEHWYYADSHGDGTGRGVIFVDGYGDLKDLEPPLTKKAASTARLPLARELSKFMIVVTTFSRCAEQSDKAQLGERQISSFASSPLLELRWLRLVVDEGHVFGGGADEDSETEETEYTAACDGAAQRRRRKKQRRRKATGRIEVRYRDGEEYRVRVRSPTEEREHQAAMAEARAKRAMLKSLDLIAVLAAERRWVMTGTPTTGATDASKIEEVATKRLARELAQLQRLMRFLRHPRYGVYDGTVHVSPIASAERVSSTSHRRQGSRRRNGGSSAGGGVAMSMLRQDANDAKANAHARELWCQEVQEPLLRHDVEARRKLVKLLECMVVVHSKDALRLPKPLLQDHEVLIERGVRENDESAFQVRVDEAQANHIIAKIREGIDRDGDATSAPPPWGRRPVKAVVYSSDRGNLLSVAEYLYRAFGTDRCAEFTDGGAGMKGRGYNSSELQRFRSSIRRFRTCPVCGLTSEDSDKRGCCQRTLLEVILDTNEIGEGHMVSRAELSALQLSAGAGPRRVLIEAERLVTSFPDDPLKNPANPVWRHRFMVDSRATSVGMGVTHALNALSIGRRVAVRLSDGVWQPRLPSEVWEQRGAASCRKLARNDKFEGQDWFFGPLPAVGDPSALPSQPPSAHAGTIAGDGGIATGILVKFGRCGHFHRPRWYSGPSLSSAPWQEEKSDTRVLFLQHDGSHGLDLSFVTHMFLLERIDDAALLQQVVARAHRLGATGSCVVETVHTFVDDKRAAASQATSRPSSTSGFRDETNHRYYCDFCYLPFVNKREAELHEDVCEKNPKCGSDAASAFFWTLSSMFREVEPRAA